MDNKQTIQIQRVRMLNNKHLHAINRRFALYRTGKSQRDIAAELNISPAAVSQAINGVRTSQPIANKLAETTGLSLAELWPDGKYQEQSA